MERVMETNELLIYQADNGAIQLRADASVETLWATQKQMADMFGVTPQNITLHLKIYLKMKNYQKWQHVRNPYMFKKKGRETFLEK